LIPVPLEAFVAYGEAFQQKMVPGVERRTLVRLESRGSDFRTVFDDGGEVIARRAVLAVGVHPFKYVPEPIAGFPAELVTHSGDHGPLDGFAGKSVAVLGSGASATDLAALVSEKGAAVTLVTRAKEIRFAQTSGAKKSLVRQMAQPLRGVVSPGSGIGRGWTLKIYADAPQLFHALPRKQRHAIVETMLGPLGNARMRDRVVGRMPILLGRELEAAKAEGGGIRLSFVASDGRRDVVSADHVIAGTGYQVSVDRLAFLDPKLRERIASENGKPTLSLTYETSVPGLHIVGPAAAFSFGPVCRFVFGAIHPARAIARALAGGRVTGQAARGRGREAGVAAE
jgi:thioredoxin reductase